MLEITRRYQYPMANELFLITFERQSLKAVKLPLEREVLGDVPCSESSCKQVILQVTT